MVTAKGLRERVFLARSQDDYRRYLRAFDIAVLASESEEFSNSVPECVAMGLPSVVTRGTKVTRAVERCTGMKWSLPAIDHVRDARRRMIEAGLAMQ